MLLRCTINFDMLAAIINLIGRQKTMAAKAKSTKTKANTTRAKASSEKTSSQAKNAYASAFDFSNFSKNFANPAQFFDASAWQNLQPANIQSLMEQVIETNQKNWEAITACTQLCAEYAKESFEEQTQFANECIQEAAASLQESFTTTSSDPREKLEELNEQAKYYLEKTAAQARKTAEENIAIAQKVGAALKERLEASVEELRNAA